MGKTYSTKYFCNVRVGGLGEIFVQQKFLVIPIIIILIHSLEGFSGSDGADGAIGGMGGGGWLL